MKRKRKCKCGCGDYVSGGKNYVKGHNFKVQKLSQKQEEERRQKISKTMKQFLKDPEQRRKRGVIWKGRTHSDETKKKLSELRKGENNPMFGKKISQKTRIKLSKIRTGRKHSDETRAKISAAKKGKTYISKEQREQISKTLKIYYSKNGGTFLGKIHNKQSKEKMRQANLGKFRGKNGPNWQGGISSFPYGRDWTPWLRQEIKNRDGDRCKICNESNKMLDVHHINFNKNNNHPSNLITLCKSCHGKANRGSIQESLLTELIKEYES